MLLSSNVKFAETSVCMLPPAIAMAEHPQRDTFRAESVAFAPLMDSPADPTE